MIRRLCRISSIRIQ